MESIQLLWPVLSAGLTVPLAQWIKAKLPQDFPIQSVLVTVIVNMIVMVALWKIFAPAEPLSAILPLALGAQVLSQIGHAGYKSVQKPVNNGGDPR
jgi:hypothetical protein